MRKPIEFVFGGVERSVTVEIGLAVKIEAATGKGVFALVDPLRSFEARLNDAVTVVRLALAESGTVYSQDKALTLCAVEGIIETQVSALRVINELFLKPDSDAAKKPKRKGSNDASPLVAETTQ